MNNSPSFFARIGSALNRLWQLWMDVLRRRPSVLRKHAAISIGLFVLLACSAPAATQSPSQPASSAAEGESRASSTRDAGTSTEGEAVEEARQPSAAPARPTATIAPPPTAVAPAALGDTLENDQWRITITGVERAATLPSNTAKGQWVILTGTAENRTTKMQILGIDDFLLSTSALNGTMDMDRTATWELGDLGELEGTVARLGGLPIDAGATVPLVMAFDVPLVATDLTLQLPALDRDVALGEAAELAEAALPTPEPIIMPTEAPTAEDSTQPAVEPDPTTDESVAAPAAPATQQGGRIPGLMPADVTVNLEQRKFDCTNAEFGQLYYRWVCERTEGPYTIHVEVYARELGAVDYIDATVLGLVDSVDPVAGPALGFIATMPYEGSTPEAARAWVENTIPTLQGQGDVREEMFGGVRYQLYGIDTFRTLEIGWLE